MHINVMKYGRGTCTIELENVSINVSESGRRRIVYFLIFLVCVCVCKTIKSFLCVCGTSCGRTKNARLPYIL